MKYYQIPKKKLKGVSRNLKISLKRYGLAWYKTRKKTIFFHGIKQNEEGVFILFEKTELNYV